MDFFAYYNGTTIEAFSSASLSKARKYIMQRYQQSHTIVIVPVSSTPAQFEDAQRESIRLQQGA